MPNKDIQTKYYNKTTRLEEWWCCYYLKTYLTLGSTSGLAGHLKEYHKVLRDLKQDIKAKNV